MVCQEANQKILTAKDFAQVSSLMNDYFGQPNANYQKISLVEAARFLKEGYGDS
jgi:hypothetical protein